MSDTPAVSVLIKSYNHARFIAQTIESALGQSFQDFEILVTDDASTDGTPEIVRRYTDPRIKLEVSPVNRGVSLGMRSLIARARGRYLAILNSDDYAMPERLARQVAHLAAHAGEAAVFTNAVEIDEAGRALSRPSVFAVPVAWPDHKRARWLRQFFFEGNCLCAPSAMLRREVLQQIEPYDPRFTNLQDLELWVRLLSRHEIGFIAEPLTAFRKRARLQNLSAPRSDTRLRIPFETLLILHHYAAMPTSLVAAIFAEELGARVLEDDAEKKKWLAEMAFAVPASAHRLFGLQMLFETAESLADYNRLRQLTGELDVFNLTACRRPLRHQAARAARLLKRVIAKALRGGARSARISARPAASSAPGSTAG